MTRTKYLTLVALFQAVAILYLALRTPPRTPEQIACDQAPGKRVVDVSDIPTEPQK